MGAWRKAGVWLGLVEDDDDRYDDEFDDDEFAVPRPRSMARPPRGVDHERLERERLDRDRFDRERERDRERIDRGRRELGARERGDRPGRDPREQLRVESDEYDEQRDPRREPYDRGRGDRRPAPAHTATAPEPRSERELRTDRDLRTDRPGEGDGRLTETRSTVRPLVRPGASPAAPAPTAGSTALSVPAPESLANAPQVQLRERAAPSDERAARRYQITTLHPTSYSEARAIGEQFRDGHPVIMNLTEMDEPDAKRLVDFAAGLAFGLRGSMERVTNRVFLLTPPNIRVSDEEKQRIAETGLFPPT